MKDVLRGKVTRDRTRGTSITMGTYDVRETSGKGRELRKAATDVTKDFEGRGGRVG